MKIKMSSKIKQVDFNSKLEEILEKKDFDVTVKNLLLSMLYKIENSYKDYSKVKVNIKNKDEKITEVLHIISEYCDKIELVTPKTVASKVLEEENKKCIIDIKKGYIKTYANEQSMLYSLYIMQSKVKRYKETFKNDEEKNLVEFYEKAYANSECEVIRDFDGWSWNVNMQNNLEIAYNLIYQLLVLVCGLDNVPKIIKKDEKYIESLAEQDKNILEQLYLLIETYVALNDMEAYKKIADKVAERKVYLGLVCDKDKFIEYVTENKKNLNKEIGKIDEITNDEKRLRDEYFERNSKLKDEDKIFSISCFEDLLMEQREKMVEEIKLQNKSLTPKEYVQLKENTKKECEFYDKLLQNIERTDVRNKTIASIQKMILERFSYRALKEEKESIKNTICELRYYLLLQINNREKIADISELAENIKNTINTVIDIAIDKQVLTNISDSTSICYDILGFIFESRNIDLEDLSVKLENKKDENIILVNIFDEKEVEKTLTINEQKITLINIKMNKRIKIFC